MNSKLYLSQVCMTGVFERQRRHLFRPSRMSKVASSSARMERTKATRGRGKATKVVAMNKTTANPKVTVKRSQRQRSSKLRPLRQIHTRLQNRMSRISFNTLASNLTTLRSFRTLNFIAGCHFSQGFFDCRSSVDQIQEFIQEDEDFITNTL